MENNLNESEASLRDYLRVIFRRKKIIFTTIITVIIGVLLGLQFKTPEYESRVKMLILAKKSIESPYYRDMSDFRTTEMTLTQSEIVKSNPVIERVVKTLELDRVGLGNEKRYSSPLMAIFLDLKSRMTNAKLAKFSERDREEIIFRRTVQDLKKKIKVEPIRNTDLFTISVLDFSPVNAAKIANTISRSYCIFDLEQQLSELEQTYGEKHLFVTQLKNNIRKMEDNLKEDRLPDIDAIGPASVKIIDQATVSIEPQGVRKSLTLLIACFLSILLGIVLAFVFESLDSTFKSPSEIKAYLGVNILGSIPRKKFFPVSLLSALKNIVGLILAAESCLLFLRMLAEWLKLDEGNSVVVLIDKLTDPLIRLARMILPFNHKFSVDIHALFMFILTIALNVLLAKLITGLSKKMIQEKLLIKDIARVSEYAHAFQNLSEQIYLTMKANGQKSALIASSLPEEGNSTVVANLAKYLSEKSGHKVLLIDANLRKPSLHKIFRIENQPGLTDVSDGTVAFDNALHSVNDNLFVLPSGNNLFEPVTILGSNLMFDIIKEAEKKFELVFLDSTNLKNYKDAVAVSSYVDGIILMINEGKTRREVLKAAIAPLKQNKANFIGAVLNNRTFAIPKMIYERA